MLQNYCNMLQNFATCCAAAFVRCAAAKKCCTAVSCAWGPENAWFPIPISPDPLYAETELWKKRSQGTYRD